MSNTLTATLTQILAKGMMGLREQVLMTRLINTDYSAEAKQKGMTIDIPIASDMGTADDVTPAATPTAGDDITTATKQITLSNWKHKMFNLNDQELTRIRAGQDFIPLQMNEAFRTIAYAINESVFDTYTGVYGYVGTAGTTPFGSGVEVSSATNVRKTLHEQLCPRMGRNAVLDFAAEAAALNLAPFSDAEKRGSSETKTSGNVGKVFGLDWYGEDQVPTHTAGTGATISTNAAGYAVDVKAITLKAAGTGTMVVGDIFTIAGDSQTYTVTTLVSAVSGGALAFEPGLKVAITTAETVITLKADHVVNLGFHPDAFGLAVRAPDMGMKDIFGVTGSTNDMGNMVTLVDEVTKLVMRIELLRGYKQNMLDIDCMWGTSLISPQRACRLAG